LSLQTTRRHGSDQSSAHQEGFNTVVETAGGMLAMFDTIKPEEDPSGVARAKESFTLGIANIAPLAWEKRNRSNRW
jgi:hypothetical protein